MPTKQETPKQEIPRHGTPRGISKIQISKTKEQILRDEIRALRETGLKLIQWGVTVQITLLTAFYYVRKDIHERLVELHKIPDNLLFLPWSRYLVGTFILFFIGLVFGVLTFMFTNRYKNYRSQLAENLQSGIKEKAFYESGRWLVILLYLAFPVLDILIRVAVQIWFD